MSYRIGAGVVATAMGASTAAFGLYQMIHPYQGNSMHSGTPQGGNPASPLLETIVALVPEVPSGLPGDEPVQDPGLSIPPVSIATDVITSAQQVLQNTLSQEPGNGGSPTPVLPVPPPSGGIVPPIVLPPGDGTQGGPGINLGPVDGVLPPCATAPVESVATEPPVPTPVASPAPAAPAAVPAVPTCTPAEDEADAAGAGQDGQAADDGTGSESQPSSSTAA
jgi:hypothetical protein